jgi:lambda family phage portal protein
MTRQTNTIPTFSPSVVDRVISFFNPAAGVNRAKAKLTLSALEETGFMVPGTSRRSMRGWNPTSKTADQDTIGKLDRSRAGCRDLSMNSPVARGSLKRELTNVVGWGLKLQSRIDRELLGMSEIEAGIWERQAEKEFQLWAKSTECDMERTSNFYELQKMAIYNTSLSGDVFFLLPWKARGNFPYELKVKLVEADYVVNPLNGVDTTNLAGGVEVDDDGAPVAYYFKKTPKGLLSASLYTTFETIRIPAYTPSGRRNVYHLYHKERPNQKRGMPMLAPVIETLKQITRLTEAELMASVVASFFTVFVKTTPAYGGMTEGFVPEEKVSGVGSSNPQPGDENVYEMANGNVIELGGEGQSIDIADPKRPNGAFEPFFLALVKQIGSAIEIPFEQIMLYFSSSYSAARGAILEAWKFYRHRRVWLTEGFCQPCYEAQLEEAILKGRIKAPGFFDDLLIRQAWCGSTWIGPGQGQLNPYQETQAADLKIQRYLSTYETEYSAIHGDDWTSAVQRNSREVNLLKTMGLPVPSPAASSGQSAPTESETIPEEPDEPPVMPDDEEDDED